MKTTLKKNTAGYGYKYTELADINEYIESIGETYYQYVEPHENGRDYIMTVRCKDGKPIMDALRGASITMPKLSGKTNPAQEQGSGITYARRYSLLMAYGLATADDDAAVFDTEKAPANEAERKKFELQNRIKEICEEKGLDLGNVCAQYGLNNNTAVWKLNEAIKILEGGNV